MKVLVVCVFPPVPLPETDHAFHIVQNLADKGVKVDVVTAKGSVEANHPNVTQFSIMGNWNWNEVPRLALCIKRSKPDAVLLYYVPHLYHEHPMITFAPSLVRALAPLARVVTLFSNCNGSSPHKMRRSGRLVHRVLRRTLGEKTDYALGTMLRDSNSVVALSRRHLRTLAESLPEIMERSLLIPPPAIMTLSADTNESREIGRQQLGVTDDMFLFAYFGYIYPGKGLDTLIRAFSLVAPQYASVRLAIIGSVMPQFGGPEYAAEIKQMVQDLGLHDKVIFTGKFDWDSIQGSIYLRAADACVLPFNEGVQMNNSSFAGAVTHGLPVVTTASPATEELFVDGENVCLCPPQDPEAMANAMQMVMSDTLLRDHLHRGALSFASEWFSWESATQRTLTALKSAA